MGGVWRQETEQYVRLECSWGCGAARGSAILTLKLLFPRSCAPSSGCLAGPGTAAAQLFQ